MATLTLPAKATIKKRDETHALEHWMYCDPAQVIERVLQRSCLMRYLRDNKHRRIATLTKKVVNGK